MLMNEKQFYTSPEVDVLVVRFEANIMSPGVGANGLQGGHIVNGGGAFDDWDD